MSTNHESVISEAATVDASKAGKVVESPASSLAISKSEISNPYFTHHSDHAGMVLVSKTLNGDNYSGWKRAMIHALNSKNKLGFINGSIKTPSEEADPEVYAAWSRCNDLVHSWLCNALDPEIVDSVQYYCTAHEVWDDLCERFSQGNAPRIFEIQRDIASLKQEQLSVLAYYTKIKGLWDELGSYSEGISAAQTDSQKLMQFLMGLNDTYVAIRGQILMMNPLPSIRQAYAAVAQEEKQRTISVTSAGDSTTGADLSAAMAVHNGETHGSNHMRQPAGTDQWRHQYRDRPPFSSRGDRPPFSSGRDRRFNFNHEQRQDQRHFGGIGRVRPHCTYCGDVGHWVQKCYQLHGFPPGHPKAKLNSGPNQHKGAHAANLVSGEDRSAISISEAQLKHLVSLLNVKNGDGTSNPQANATVNKPGSDYEEDDWFG